MCRFCVDLFKYQKLHRYAIKIVLCILCNLCRGYIMANVSKAKWDKKGNIYYDIKVFKCKDERGISKFYNTRFRPDNPNWSEKTVQKKLNEFVVEFEKKCRDGLIVDTKQTFREYSAYVLELKERTGTKKSTISGYKDKLKPILDYFGDMKLANIKPHHINEYYKMLLSKGSRRTDNRAIADVKALEDTFKSSGLLKKDLMALAEISSSTMQNAFKGLAIVESSAIKISNALRVPVKRIFSISVDDRPLSAKSIREHKNILSMVFETAVNEGLILDNPVKRAVAPKTSRNKAETLQPNEVQDLIKALELEPKMWRILVLLALYTGARRGELFALTWDSLDFNDNRIHIDRNLLYRKDEGIYLDTPKTDSSIRWVTIPNDIMELLKEYHQEQMETIETLGSYYVGSGEFIFSRDNGLPLHPDTFTDWLNRFCKRHDLPHIHPHTLRHTSASVLIFSGLDIASVSKRLGHSDITTTLNVYTHAIQEADRQASDTLSNAFKK